MRMVEEFLSRSQYNALHQFKFLSTVQGRDDEQVVSFVQQILLDAVRKKASDVHIEPYKTSYRIRLRVDGILHQVAEFSVELSNRIIARLKIMSKLDISERRLPQDGRFTLNMSSQQTMDCRVNVCPTLGGEKLVIRILDANHTSLNIDDLGFEEEQKRLFLQAIQRPQGMILITGPTGSGKTVTLYSILNYLNISEKNICSVEDPIEIQLLGINQVNVHPKINLDFPNVLRAFLRQDPDIIMIGEIRDQETAEIAIKAAQTGHLVLSTLHTNNATETITRLLAMNLPMYAIASVINLVVAQRLLRKLCVYCRCEFSCDLNMLQKFECQEEAKKSTLFKPVGCEKCMNGYSGRTGVFEILPITAYLSHLMMQNVGSLKLVEEAKRLGMLALREAAIKKILSGIGSTAAAARRLPARAPWCGSARTRYTPCRWTGPGRPARRPVSPSSIASTPRSRCSSVQHAEAVQPGHQRRRPDDRHRRLVRLPTIRHDLGKFDRTFGLPAPPRSTSSAGRCRYQPTRTQAGPARPTWTSSTPTRWPRAQTSCWSRRRPRRTRGLRLPADRQGRGVRDQPPLGNVISQSFSATEQTFP